MEQDQHLPGQRCEVTVLKNMLTCWQAAAHLQSCCPFANLSTRSPTMCVVINCLQSLLSSKAFTSQIDCSKAHMATSSTGHTFSDACTKARHIDMKDRTRLCVMLMLFVHIVAGEHTRLAHQLRIVVGFYAVCCMCGFASPGMHYSRLHIWVLSLLGQGLPNPACLPKARQG